MKPDSWKITKDMTVAQALHCCPCLNRVLGQLGLACCACFGAETDTIEDVARVYGFDPELFVHTLNVARLFGGEPNPPSAQS